MNVYGAPGTWSWSQWIKNTLKNMALYACMWYLLACLAGVIYMCMHA